MFGRLSDPFGDEWQSIGFGHQTREIMHQKLALDTIWTFQVVSDDIIINFAVFCSENTMEGFTGPTMLGSPTMHEPSNVRPTGEIRYIIHLPSLSRKC